MNALQQRQRGSFWTEHDDVTTCNRCGAEILLRTADRHGGLCVPGKPTSSSGDRFRSSCRWDELGLQPWLNVRERLEVLQQQKRFILRFRKPWIRWFR